MPSQRLTPRKESAATKRARESADAERASRRRRDAEGVTMESENEEPEAVVAPPGRICGGEEKNGFFLSAFAS